MSAADPRRHTFTFKIEQVDNSSFVASVVHDAEEKISDDAGALYYVVAVIFIYGCSILMMIASYIRKNNADQKLNRYLKDMASVRKREQQWQLFNAAAKAAAHRESIASGHFHEIAMKKISSNSMACSDLSECDTDWEQEPSNHGNGHSRSPNTLTPDVSQMNYVAVSDNEDSTEGDVTHQADEGSDGASGGSGNHAHTKLKPQKSILKSTKCVTLVVPEEMEEYSSTQRLLSKVSPQGTPEMGSRSRSASVSEPQEMTPFLDADGLQVVSTV